MISSHFLAVLKLACLSFVTAKYIWPSPNIDSLGDHYTEGFLNLDGVSPIPCNASLTGEGGRQTAAEWLRTAFHDAVTHDAKTGLGGLDASLAYELDRAENPGAALPDTFDFFGSNGFVTKYASSSDLLALLTIVTMQMCNGPQIPFRVGRIDAWQAGPPGVPKPTQDLPSTLVAFQNAGFSIDEMIALVACGHSLGGVHGVDFPEITPVGNSPTNPSGMAFFTSDTSMFSNKIASQYVNGPSVDVLAVGSNKTTEPDLRVFNADRNTTIKSFASSMETFNQTCGRVFEKMINTVPRNVKLSEPLVPIRLKPQHVTLRMDNSGIAVFRGTVRILGFPANSNRFIEIDYVDRNNNALTNYTIKTNTTLSVDTVAPPFGFYQKYLFNATVDSNLLVSSFKIAIVDGPRADQRELSDNEGLGYRLQTEVLYGQESCVVAAPDGSNGTATLNLVAYVRDSHTAPNSNAKVTIAFSQAIFQPGIKIPQLHPRIFPMSQGESLQNAPYTTFSASIQIPQSSFDFSTFDIVLEDRGVKYIVDLVLIGFGTLKAC